MPSVWYKPWLSQGMTHNGGSVVCVSCMIVSAAVLNKVYRRLLRAQNEHTYF